MITDEELHKYGQLYVSGMWNPDATDYEVELVGAIQALLIEISSLKTYIQDLECSNEMLKSDLMVIAQEGYNCD